MDDFDLCGALRRIRRIADLSQRELAASAGLTPSAVAHAEAGSRDLPVRALERAAGVAGLRLALVTQEGAHVAPMAPDTVRDMAGRRFPAHLDVRYGDEDWWHGDNRYEREQPWYTFDRLRHTRDHWRTRSGTPEDHQRPGPDDAPEQRRAARQRAARLRRDEELARRRAAGEIPPLREWVCSCPPRCEELDDRSGRPVHADGCPCLCDVA